MCQNRQWSVVAKILTSEDSADFLPSLFIQEMNHTSCGWDWWISVVKHIPQNLLDHIMSFQLDPQFGIVGPCCLLEREGSRGGSRWWDRQ